MRRGEAPGRTLRSGPDPVRVLAGIFLATAALVIVLTPRSAPRRRVARVPPLPITPSAPASPRTITFESLGGFAPPSIPKDILALDGAEVQLAGYVMPMKMDGPRLAAFMLMGFQPDCCFGQEPRVNDWVMVAVPPALDLRPANLDFARVTGRLVVNPVKDPQGNLMGLYLLKAATVTTADGPG